MIKKEITTSTELKAKGKLVAFDDVGLHIEDEKTGETTCLSMDAIKAFVDEQISLTIKTVNKDELIPEEE